MNNRSQGKRTVRRPASPHTEHRRRTAREPAGPFAASSQHESVSAVNVSNTAKQVDESVLRSKSSVLLLSLPEVEQMYIPVSNKETKEMNEAKDGIVAGRTSPLDDCSITSIHVAEGAVTKRTKIPIQVSQEEPLHTSVLPQFGTQPFTITDLRRQTEVNIVFDEPFAGCRYAIVGMANAPGLSVTIKKQYEHSAVLTVERSPTCTRYEGIVSWIAVGYE